MVLSGTLQHKYFFLENYIDIDANNNNMTGEKNTFD